MGRSWFRNATRARMNPAGVYHAARADWMRSGRALCGADIANPGWTIAADLAAYELGRVQRVYRFCQHCERKARQIDNVTNGKIA